MPGPLCRVCLGVEAASERRQLLSQMRRPSVLRRTPCATAALGREAKCAPSVGPHDLGLADASTQSILPPTLHERGTQGVCPALRYAVVISYTTCYQKAAASAVAPDKTEAFQVGFTRVPWSCAVGFASQPALFPGFLYRGRPG